MSDLNLTINAFSTVNLLDNKHYSYTIQQLEKSFASGSLFKKRNRFKLRKNAPEIITNKILFDRDIYSPTRQRSILQIKQENYDELNLSDEKFAEENADLVDLVDINKK